MTKRFVGILGLLLLVFLGACGQLEIQEAVVSSLPTNMIASAETVEFISTPTAITTPIPSAAQTISNSRLPIDLFWLRSNLANTNGLLSDFQSAYGEIWRWKAGSPLAERFISSSEDSVILVPGPILDFKTHGNQILVSLVIGRDKESGYRYQLGVVDLISGTYHVLVEDKRASIFPDFPFQAIAISPNGDWVSYILGVLDEERFNINIDRFFDFEFYYVSTDGEGEPIRIGECTSSGLLVIGNCLKNVRWAPDSLRIAWHGGEGLWVTTIGEGNELLIEDLTDAEYGRDFVQYLPENWSADGQYLLYSRWGWEWNERGILHPESKSFQEIAESYTSHMSPVTQVSLGNSNHLVVVQSDFVEAEKEKHINSLVYEVDSTSTSLLVNEIERYSVSSHLGDILYEPFVLPDGDLLWVIKRSTDVNGDPLVRQLILLASFDLDSNELTELNQYELPTETNRVSLERLSWLQDASGVLVETDEKIIYISADGSVSISIDHVVGNSDSCCFAWVDN